MTTSITGKIVEVLPPKSGVSKSGNEWMSQEYVLEEENKDRIVFNVFGAQKINEYNLLVGTIAAVTLKIESTSWNGKYYTKLSCIGCVSNTANQQPIAQPQQQVQQQRPIQTPSLDAARVVQQEPQTSVNDLPF
jgi:hypothetical protein